MINSLGTIAFFCCDTTATYRRKFCEYLNKSVKKYGYNIIHFNFVRSMASIDDYGSKFLEIVPLNDFAGIIFDEESFHYDELSKKLIKYLKENVKCPVISVSSRIDGWCSIAVDASKGISEAVRHFTEHHGFDRIGFMSGYYSHPDAEERINAFRREMAAHGLPEEGSGIFEGDFWYNKGEEAVDFFFAEGREKPQAIICANDFMAIALCNALEKRGYRVPEDVCLSGYDGTDEAYNFIPRLTTVDCRKNRIAETAVRIIDELAKGKITELPQVVYTEPELVTASTCGCVREDYKADAKRLNDDFPLNRFYSYSLANSEISMLKMNNINNISDFSEVFSTFSQIVGQFSRFFLMAYMDESGECSYEKDFYEPSRKLRPALWLDYSENRPAPESFDAEDFIPDSADDTPRYYYVSELHSSDHCFGYAAILMKGEEPFNLFYNLWLVNISVSLESLMRSNKIRRFISDLEKSSCTDGLTGLLNRKGFDGNASAALSEAGEDSVIFTAVVDMDGLKSINDIYGHQEGDFAIRTLAGIVRDSCSSGELVCRAGGDEFYVFAADYSEEKMNRFLMTVERKIAVFNSRSQKNYVLSASCGAYTAKSSAHTRIEDFLKVSDERMYAVKCRKPNRRR